MGTNAKTSKTSRKKSKTSRKTPVKSSRKKTSSKETKTDVPVKKKSSFLVKTGKVIGYTVAGLATTYAALAGLAIYNYFRFSREIHNEVEDLRKNFYDKNVYYDPNGKILQLRRLQKKIHTFLQIYGTILKNFKGINVIYSDLRTINKVLEKLENGSPVTPKDLEPDNMDHFNINDYIEKEDKDIFSKRLTSKDIRNLRIKYHPDNIPRNFKGLPENEIKKKILNYNTVYQYLGNYK